MIAETTEFVYQNTTGKEQYRDLVGRAYLVTPGRSFATSICGRGTVELPTAFTGGEVVLKTSSGNELYRRVAPPTEKPVVKPTNPKDTLAVTKVPLWLLSPIAKAHWAVAQGVGLGKYGAWNWRVAGVRSSIYLSAIERHFDRYVSGESHDPVDGQHNLGAIMACCAILLDAEAAGKLLDDRPPSVGVQKTYDEVEAVFKASIERARAAGYDPVHYTIKDTNAV